MKKAGFTVVETFCVEGLRKFIKFVVEMVANLVQQRAQITLESDYALVFRGAHPELNLRRLAILFRQIQAVQFAPVVARPDRQHLDAQWRNLQLSDDAIRDLLRQPLNGHPVFRFQCLNQCLRGWPQDLCMGQFDRDDRIALPVDALPAGRKPFVVIENQRVQSM